MFTTISFEYVVYYHKINKILYWVFTWVILTKIENFCVSITILSSFYLWSMCNHIVTKNTRDEKHFTIQQYLLVLFPLILSLFQRHALFFNLDIWEYIQNLFDYIKTIVQYIRWGRHSVTYRCILSVWYSDRIKEIKSAIW